MFNIPCSVHLTVHACLLFAQFACLQCIVIMHLMNAYSKYNLMHVFYKVCSTEFNRAYF